jgi:ABC-type transport system involved in multi-copper enzyme maturation permease subunit
MTLVTGVPVLCAVILFLFRGVVAKEGVTLESIFPQISFYLYLHFLLPLTAVFVGSALIADEVDDRTLPYLLTRPVPRTHVLLAKALAAVFTLGLLLFISLGLSYSIMMLPGGPGTWITHIPDLLQAAGVLLLGLIVYIPLFGIFGGVMTKPVLVGLLFTFGYENTVAFFPGNIKLFSMAYYMHRLFPNVYMENSQSVESKLLAILLPPSPVSPAAALAVLLGLGILFFAAFSMLLSWKEFRLEQT